MFIAFFSHHGIDIYSSVFSSGREKIETTRAGRSRTKTFPVTSNSATAGAMQLTCF